MKYAIQEVVRRELTADEFRTLACIKPDRPPIYAIGDIVSFQKRDRSTAYGAVASVSWEGIYDTVYKYKIKWANLVEQESFKGPFELSDIYLAESEIMAEERIKFSE